MDESKLNIRLQDEQWRDTIRKFRLARNALMLPPLLTRSSMTILGLSQAEFHLINMLFELGSMSQKELLARLYPLKKDHVSRLVVGLKKRGWISSQRSSNDRRVFELSLTDHGRQEASARAEVGYAATLVQLSNFSEEEVEDYLRTLEKVAEYFQRTLYGAFLPKEFSATDQFVESCIKKMIESAGYKQTSRSDDSLDTEQNPK